MQFLDMGGYAPVRLAVLRITLAVVVLNIVWARRALRARRARRRGGGSAMRGGEPMTPRQRRLTLVLGIVAGVGIAGALALSAFRQNVTFFFDPDAGGRRAR